MKNFWDSLMAEKRKRIIALSTLLFFLMLFVLHFMFSPTRHPKAIPTLPPEPTTAETSVLTPREALTVSQPVSPFNALPTNADILATIEDRNKKQKVSEERTVEKAEKAAKVMAIVRGKAPAPDDPWKKKNPSEKPDSISYEELRAGIKAKRYFVR